MNNLITQNLRENILKISLNNPSAQNTLSLDFINELKKIIKEAEKNTDVKVIVINSIGKVFSAGHNLILIEVIKIKDCSFLQP